MQSYEKLEYELMKWTKLPHVAVCSSGTAALHLALESLQLPEGSRVIVPNYTMIACARAVKLARLEPVFVDCGNNLNIDVEGIESICHELKLRNRPVSALLAVHIYGRRCNMEAIHKLAQTYQFRVIEDMAELHGIKPHHQSVAACWSFYKNKVVGGEEGGAVGFMSQMSIGSLMYVKSLRNLGLTEDHNYYHKPFGHNYRLADCLAEKILHSLEMFESNFGLRRYFESCYDIYCVSLYRQESRQSPWVYDIRIGGMDKLTQDILVNKLKAIGIEARHGFKPMTSQLEFASYRNNENSSRCERAATEVITLPLSNITREKIEKSYEVLGKVVTQ